MVGVHRRSSGNDDPQLPQRRSRNHAILIRGRIKLLVRCKLARHGTARGSLSCSKAHCSTFLEAASARGHAAAACMNALMEVLVSCANARCQIACDDSRAARKKGSWSSMRPEPLGLIYTGWNLPRIMPSSWVSRRKLCSTSRNGVLCSPRVLEPRVLRPDPGVVKTST